MSGSVVGALDLVEAEAEALRGLMGDALLLELSDREPAVTLDVPLALASQDDQAYVELRLHFDFPQSYPEQPPSVRTVHSKGELLLFLLLC